MRALAGVAMAMAVGAVGSASADNEAIPADAPVLSAEVPSGRLAVTALPNTATSADRAVDGEIGDWIGTPSNFAGATIRSHGELIYTDHLYDSYGADDGGDVKRMQTDDAAASVVPEAYRLDPAQQLDLLDELGVGSTPGVAESKYGDAFDPRADLRELRLAADADSVWVLGEMVILTPGDRTSLLLLVDDAPGTTERPVGLGTNLKSTKADHAVLLTGSTGKVIDLATGQATELPAGSVATNPAGYTNAIEARIPRAALGGASTIGVAALAGAFDGTKLTPSNVAFRESEPAREAFEKQQALDLYAGSVERFFAAVDLDALAAGQTQSWTPGRGYYERVFRSRADISTEGGSSGIYQRYGIYVPRSYAPGTESPLQWWLHWRGGKAHSAATLTPRVFKQFGEDVDSLVVSPEGRDSSSWYVGNGMVDIEEVRADLLKTFTIDPNRVYVTGHSMGGWGSYLLSITHPDWFAAALPVSGPVTQGDWTGLDFPGCDTYHYDDYSFCYVQANDGDARTQHTKRLLGNLRNTPIGIFQGVEDELVTVSGVLLQWQQLVSLGYRHRLYLFLASEHYTHPLIDQWQEGATYLHSFTRDPNPHRVTFTRDMPFEHATERIHASVPLNFDFDRAYWMSELTPANAGTGVATFDGTTAGRPEHPQLAIPEGGGPVGVGQTSPYLMSGLRWMDDPTLSTPAKANAFKVTLTGATAVRLDLARMGLDAGQPLNGVVVTNTALDLRLDGGYAAAPAVTLGGQPVNATVADGVLHVSVPAGSAEQTLVVG